MSELEEKTRAEYADYLHEYEDGISALGGDKHPFSMHVLEERICQLKDNFYRIALQEGWKNRNIK